jgi:hypothetical protein
VLRALHAGLAAGARGRRHDRQGGRRGHRAQADDRRAAELVYNGHPLYTTDADVKPGDTNGQAVFNTWFAVSASGKQVGKGDPNAGGY